MRTINNNVTLSAKSSLILEEKPFAEWYYLCAYIFYMFTCVHSQHIHEPHNIEGDTLNITSL